MKGRYFSVKPVVKNEVALLVNIDEQKSKTKVYIFVYKIFTKSYFKSYTAIAMGFHALGKSSH